MFCHFHVQNLKNHETKGEQYTHHEITRNRGARQSVVIPVLRNVFLEMELKPEGEIRTTLVNNEGKCYIMTILHDLTS